MKESKFVKTKIVAGYLLLIAVCILSVGYVAFACNVFSFVRSGPLYRSTPCFPCSAGRTVMMLSTTNFVKPRQGSAPKYSL